MIETTGEGKSAVATPDGKSRKKKKKKLFALVERATVSNVVSIPRPFLSFNLTDCHSPASNTMRLTMEKLYTRRRSQRML